jgi:formylglycine-generating enzyme required for sulfatase activity
VRCVRDADANTLSISTVNIPAGTFTMGSPATEVDRAADETQYQVTLDAYRMSKYDITNTQYAAFLNAKSIGSDGLYAAGAYPTQALIYDSYVAYSGSYDFGLHYSGTQWVPVVGYENNPLIDVTWYGAAEYATYVGGTLPTEAQWEYACRAGTTTPFNTGTCLTNLQANYSWSSPFSTCTNTVTTPLSKTQPVGSYAPNAYGLYDMHGNVWQWCADWYGAYPTTAQTNPTGATTGSYRVGRGGGWVYGAQYCRSAYRTYCNPDYNRNELGFRVVFVP